MRPSRKLVTWTGRLPSIVSIMGSALLGRGAGHGPAPRILRSAALGGEGCAADHLHGLLGLHVEHHAHPLRIVGGPVHLAVGVAGVFIETHQDPDHAPSDGPNMLPLKDLEALLRKLMEFDSLAKH